MSPDGETIAFEYRMPYSAPPAGLRTASGLGLYRWRTGELTRIPNPPTRQLGRPSFGWDGRQLFCMRAVLGARDGGWSEIGVLDLAGRDERVLLRREEAPLRFLTANLALRPDGRALLYARQTWPHPSELILHSLASGEEQTVLPSGEAPYLIGNLAFMPPDIIVFSFVSGHDSALAPLVDANGMRQFDTALGRLRIGETPELYFPRRPEDVFLRGDGGTSGVVASRDGSTVLFIARSRERPSGPRGQFHYEVFRMGMDDTPVAVTRITGLLMSLAVSANGRVASVLENRQRTRDLSDFDLCVVDVATGGVMRTGLLAKLRSRWDFANP